MAARKRAAGKSPKPGPPRRAPTPRGVGHDQPTKPSAAKKVVAKKRNGGKRSEAKGNKGEAKLPFDLAPLEYAQSMIREIKGWPLLGSYRGAAPVDYRVLQETLLRVSQLVSDFPEIAEMDLNPFIAEPKGKPSLAVDARIRLDPTFVEPQRMS